MLGLVTAGASAAAAIVYLAHNGNSKANWFAICQQFNSFCERISGSLIGSFVGIVVFILLIFISAVALCRGWVCSLTHEGYGSVWLLFSFFPLQVTVYVNNCIYFSCVSCNGLIWMLVLFFMKIFAWDIDWIWEAALKFKNVCFGNKDINKQA